MLLIAAIAGAVLGAGPAVGARHHGTRFVARKARSYGHVPARPGRPPLVGTLPGTSTTPTTPTTTGPGTTTPAPACPTALGVTEDEYHTILSRPAACPGTLLIQLRNAGEDPHNLAVQDVATGTIVAKWADADPGAVATKAVPLAAGTYKLYCTLPTHDEQGMHAVFTVG